jgi:hypothetical protein
LTGLVILICELVWVVVSGRSRQAILVVKTHGAIYGVVGAARETGTNQDSTNNTFHDPSDLVIGELRSLHQKTAYGFRLSP